MKIRLPLIVEVCILLFGVSANAQITNLTVVGSGANFSVVSGDSFYWSYNLPSGAAANCEIWYDVNQNGSIDPATDFVFAAFTQTDGDTNGHNGPGDMDGLVNGHNSFGQKIGIAPGKYIVKFSNGGSSMSVAGTVTPLVSPAHQVSGHITVPAGYSSQYIVFEMKASQSHSDKFWDGITDASGNYTISMDADTAGNPWRVRLNNNYPSLLISAPSETAFTIAAANYNGINFVLTKPSAQVAGKVRDESGNPLTNWGVHLNSSMGSLNRYSQTDNNGFFQLGLLAGELPANGYSVESDMNGDVTSTMLTAQRMLPTINLSDSIYRILVVYSANSQISGQVQIDGHTPGFPIQMAASCYDTAFAQVWADGSTGNFSIPVSNKLNTYGVFPISLFGPYNVGSVNVHAGASGVIVNITTTSVVERNPGVPYHYVLNQNYPNPFNPTTNISFSLPKASTVILKLYDVLGRKVIDLVNQEMAPGNYSIPVDGSNLSSGLYFYRLRAGQFSAVKKMFLLR